MELEEVIQVIGGKVRKEDATYKLNRCIGCILEKENGVVYTGLIMPSVGPMERSVMNLLVP
jgi:hypothetical protein